MNLDRAVALVRRSDWRTALASAAKAADARALASDGQRVLRGEFWTYDAPRVTAGGSDTKTYTTTVGSTTEKLFVSLAHPSAGTVGANLFSYTVTVTNPKGVVVGTTTESPTAGSGTSTALVDLRQLKSPAGTYKVTVVGDYAASDPDTLDSDSALGRMITLHVAQLAKGSARRTRRLQGKQREKPLHDRRAQLGRVRGDQHERGRQHGSDAEDDQRDAGVPPLARARSPIAYRGRGTGCRGPGTRTWL